MCALFGFLADIERPDFVLDQMSSVLLHRGPDDRGKYIDGRLGLGHNRLSVIDLSTAGHQPMVLEKDGLVLVFNGEIFNYRELRKELSGEFFFFGNRFRSFATGIQGVGKRMSSAVKWHVCVCHLGSEQKGIVSGPGPFRYQTAVLQL